MKVILLKSVPKVGKAGDVVEVSDGYAANALFPNKSAIAATAKNLEVLNRKKRSNEELKAFQHGLLEQAIAAIPNTSIEIKVRANEKGHLFSKVDEQAIVEALLKHRISISSKNIILASPIKELGTYKVGVREGDYSAEIDVVVTQA
jgi:large subunit ribosomal protein L9